jgi:hypothetical protein
VYARLAEALIHRRRWPGSRSGACPGPGAVRTHRRPIVRDRQAAILLVERPPAAERPVAVAGRGAGDAVQQAGLFLGDRGEGGAAYLLRQGPR